MFKKFMPARGDFEVIADIDAVISKPIGFTLHGKDHRINPITTELFLIWSNALANLWNLKSKENVKEGETLDAYYTVINSLCPSITLEDIKKCEPSQVAAIYGIILDHATGRIRSEDEKKKTLQQAPG